MVMIIITIIHIKDTLQIMARNKQQNLDLGMPVES